MEISLDPIKQKMMQAIKVILNMGLEQ